MKVPEPIGCGYVVKWERGDTPSTYKSGYAQVLGVNVYDKQALFDLLEEAARDMETRPTWLTNIAAAKLIRKLKETL
jgi:hypothetical protein